MNVSMKEETNSLACARRPVAVRQPGFLLYKYRKQVFSPVQTRFFSAVYL